MGRIKKLPLAGILTGTEWLEIEQNGAPKRMLLTGLPGGGGGGSTAWGTIAGTLTHQTDLVTYVGAQTANGNTAFAWGNHAGLYSLLGHLHDAADITTGVLSPLRGGTGINSYTAGDLIYASSSSVLSKLSVGSNGHVLTLASGVPTWAAPSGGSVAGSNTQVQFNNSGAMGADAAFLWDNTNKIFKIATPATNNTVRTVARFYNPGSGGGTGVRLAFGYADNDSSVSFEAGYLTVDSFRFKISNVTSFECTSNGVVFGSRTTGNRTYAFNSQGLGINGGIAINQGATSAWRIFTNGSDLVMSGSAGTDYFWKGGYNTGTANEFKSPANAATDIIIKTTASTSQTANIQEWRDSSGNILAAIGNVGQMTLNSTTKGFLPPRMTTTQKNAIASPAAGLVVFDTTLNKLCVYTTAWETITSV